MKNKAAIALQNVSMQFGDSLVLDDINITLEKGKVHCLMGYNGSGKSTLVKILSGECPPTKGHVVFEGKTYPKWNTVQAVSRGVMSISGYASLFPRETVYENMEYSLMQKKKGPFPLLMHRAMLKRAIKDFAKKYEIKCTPSTPLMELTNGDRVLLELLRVQLMSVKVLLVDEIDVVLGRRHKKIILQIINEIKAKGVAVLYISHKLDVVKSVADQVSILQYGSTVHFEEKKSFEENDLVEMMFSSTKERPPRMHKQIGAKLLSISPSHQPKQEISLYEGEIVGIWGRRVKGEAGLYDLLFGKENIAEVRMGFSRLRPMKLESALDAGIVVISSAMMSLTQFPGYSVLQNMLPYNIVRRVRSDQDRNQICQRYINILNIRTTPSATFETLSMGRQRKVFIARSILSKGDIFLFDNPTDSIDSISKIDIYNIINELKNKGKGIFLLSEDPGEIMGICDRVVTMNGNQIVAQYEATNFSRKALEDSMEQPVEEQA
ncbi:MAG: ATP-binding cassette domain-containing protein [Oscillospiraceae bacterium]